MAYLADKNNPGGFAALALAACIEYVFPPFPGDTITLFGAVLITAYGWSFAGIFGAVMAGSMAGSMLAFYLGDRWRERRSRAHAKHGADISVKPGAPASVPHKAPANKDAERSAVIDRLVAKFLRHGAAYLVINRFLPGVRSLFFVAAGLAGMRPLAVLFYSALSAALWNLGLVAIGVLLGANFDTLVGWVRQYMLAVWILIGIIVAVGLGRALWRRTKASAS